MTQKTLTNQYESRIHKLILKVCHRIELPLHFNHKGNKNFTNNQRVALLILRQRMRVSYRRFVEFLYESKWTKWLGLKEIPGKSTLHDWAKLFGMNQIRLFCQTLLAKEKPKIMAVDGTGLDSRHQSRHFEKRLKDFGIRQRIPHVKLDAIVDVDTKIIHDWSLRVKPRHDVLAANSFMKRTKVKNALILGDGAYDSEPLHRLTISKGNTLHAPVRKSSRNFPKGWYRHKCMKKHPKYGMRSIVENVFSVLKPKYGPLKAKNHHMRKREMAWRILNYNIERLAKLSKSILCFKQVHKTKRRRLSLIRD